MSQSIGQIVRARREAAGWSRLGLAYHAGISLPAVQLIEDGRRTDPRVSTIVRISRALNVPTDVLLSNVQ